MSLFQLGRIVMTSGVSDIIEYDPEMRMFIDGCVKRHSEGDWGDLCDDDREMNDAAIEAEKGGEKYTDSLMSVYKKDGSEFWIITEWDRSVTTILLPSEY